MPSPIAHTLGAYAGLILLQPKSIATPQSRRKMFGLAAIFGSLADVDFLIAQFTKNPVLQHHYFTHSIPFAIFVGLIAYLVLRMIRSKSPGKMALLITFAYSTHLLLDYFTQDGGKPYGIPLLWPITHQHFVSPIIIFFSIHRGSWNDLFSSHNLIGLCIEFLVMYPFVFFAEWRAERLQSRMKEPQLTV